MKEDIENRESVEERLYGLSKIIEDSIEGDWTGIIHTKWLEEVRDIIHQVRQDDIKSLIGQLENMRERYKNKAVFLADASEYDPVNMLRNVGTETGYVVQNLMDTERELSDIISHFQSQLRELN
jgi:hypothetical protein